MKYSAVKLKPQQNKMNLNNLKLFFTSAINNHLPVALWHSSTDKKSFGITSFSGVSKEMIDFEKLQGFVFSTFESSDKTFFISDDIIMDESGSYKTSEKVNNNDLDNFLKTIEEQKNQNTQKLYWFTNYDKDFKDYSKEEYVSLVKESIEFIKTGEAKKVVTSRTKIIDLNSNFDPLELFEKLINKYPYAFISLISIPEVGTWIGATPEILMKIEEKKLTTMALAGTQIYKGQPTEEVEWGLKEKEEQLTVSEYIEERFLNSKATNFNKSLPETVIAGNVLHIQTLFNYQSENITKFATDFIKEFSPTPAVCGYPKEKAMTFLMENELHKRNFYSGFLGTVNLSNKSELFVNLRCMQIKNDKAIMYIGGGLTADSIPEKEWYETELKSQTLLSVINESI